MFWSVRDSWPIFSGLYIPEQVKITAFIPGGRKRLHSKQRSRELTWRTEGTCERQTAPAIGRSPAFNCSRWFWAIWWITNNEHGHWVVVMEQDRHRTFRHHARAPTKNTVWKPTKHLQFLAYTCDFQFIAEKPSRGASLSSSLLPGRNCWLRNSIPVSVREEASRVPGQRLCKHHVAVRCHL